VVCGGCGGALAEGARFCSSCGAAAPKESPEKESPEKESPEPVAVARGAGGLLGRSLLERAPTTPSETVARRLADEGWSIEAPPARGLALRRAQPTRRPVGPIVDAAGREELLTVLLADDPTPRPRERFRLLALIGARRGR
jgi:hypothetical protein